MPFFGRLDADTRRLLARIAEDYAGLADLDIAARRALLADMARRYGPPPAPVGAVEDLPIDGPAGSIPIRIYRPRSTARTLPVILHLHGGGWALGDPDSYERIARAYCAAARAIVIDVHYRRAPENKYPAALDDAEAALAWASVNARALGGDPARIAVAGDSAGGNLAAALAQRAPARLNLQILVYPVMSASAAADFPSRRRFGDGRYFLTQDHIAVAEQEYLSSPQQGEEPAASPILARDLSGLPPALIITAAFDPLRDEGEAYARRLRRDGVKTSLWRAAGTIHAFVMFAGEIAKGRRAITLIGRAVRRARLTP